MHKLQHSILENKKIFVGLEDSKRTWRLCVKYRKNIIQEVSMPTHLPGLSAYFKRHFPGCKIHVIYEAGFQGFWLADYLNSHGINCVVTPPNRVTQEKCSSVKTDKIDARRLAINLENGDYTACFIPSLKQREDREVVRTLNQIQNKITSTKNQIRKFCDFHGLNGDLKAGIWSQAIYDRLESLPMSPTLRFSFNIKLNLLKYLLEQRKELLAKLKAISEEEDYRRPVEILQSLPGVGALTAVRLVLEWGKRNDFKKRFTSKERFASYLGLTPTEYSSGETERKGHITHQGNKTVRTWLIESSWFAVRKDPVLMRKFQKVWHNTGSKKKAIVAIARKLAVRMRALLLNDQEYQLGLIR